MPKTKKQSKSKKLLNWLRPTTPAKGMLLFAIAFAIIGGAYMAFKSSAATAAYEFDDTSPTLTPFVNTAGVSIPSTILDSNTYASKNGTYAIDLKRANQGGNMSDTNNIDKFARAAAKMVHDTYNSTRTCAVLRAPSGGSTGVWLQTVNQGQVYYYSVSGSSYHEVCTAWHTVNRSVPVAYPGLLFNDGAEIYLYEIKLEAN